MRSAHGPAADWDSRPLAPDLQEQNLETYRAIVVRRSAFLKQKRMFDIAASVAALFILTPLWLVVAISIRITSPGPILYRSARVGMGGKHFFMLKFRTMYHLTKEEHARYYKEIESTASIDKQSLRHRVTPIGRLLRRSSLDELPQLINVIKGDMSLVGPRPLASGMLYRTPTFALLRSLVLPGMTGRWQVMDRSNNSSAAFMIDHDLRYIRSLSWRDDIDIMLRTVIAVVTGKGAL